MKDLKDLKALAYDARKNILRVAHDAGRNAAHIGPALSSVDILTVLFNEYFDPAEDIFILSKGHGALGYYVTMYVAGFITKDQLDTFETNGGDFPGHPTRSCGNMVSCSTGSLGMGLSYGIGRAWSMKKENQPGKVIVLLGDGELNEGSNWEGVMLAKQLGLQNLVAVIDRNRMQQDGSTDGIISLDFEKIWGAFGWKVVSCDGHDIVSLEEAFDIESDGVPKVIIAQTIKGKGVSFMENNRAWHHNTLNEEQYEQAMKELEA